MKKIIAVAAAVMISFSAQAQELSEDNKNLVELCSSDSAEAKAVCKGIMIGFKIGFLNGAFKGGMIKDNQEYGIRVRNSLAKDTYNIVAEDMIAEYARVLKRNKKYRSLPVDYAIGQAFTNLYNEAN